MTRKLPWLSIGLMGLLEIGRVGIGAPARAQELLCPETGIPMSKDPGCVIPNSATHEPPPPLPSRRIPPGMDPANLPPSDVPPGHYWGSVVTASNRQIYTAYAQPDRQTAEREALGKCQGAATGCSVVETVRVRDLALATDGTQTFSASAVGQQEAIDKALKRCRKQGNDAAGQCRASMLFNPVTGPLPEDAFRIIFGQ